MSRVTVEDCLDKVNGYFELTHLASKRAIELSVGAQSLTENEKETKKEKPAVTALREVAEGKINKDYFANQEEKSPERKLQMSDWIRKAKEKSELYEKDSF